MNIVMVDKLCGRGEDIMKANDIKRFYYYK